MPVVRSLILTSHTPESHRLRRVLELCIVDSGAEVIRLDEFPLGSSWVDPIMEGIRKADLIFCDITSGNPNIFYELGIAHALSKTTVLLRSRDCNDRMPSDLQGFLYWAYDPNTPEDRLAQIVKRAIVEATKLKGDDVSKEGSDA